MLKALLRAVTSDLVTFYNVFFNPLHLSCLLSSCLSNCARGLQLVNVRFAAADKEQKDLTNRLLTGEIESQVQTHLSPCTCHSARWATPGRGHAHSHSGDVAVNEPNIHLN